jgi:hypothetical protein
MFSSAIIAQEYYTVHTYDTFDEEHIVVGEPLTDATASPSSTESTAETLITILANSGVEFGEEKGRVYFDTYFAYGGHIIEWTNTKIVTKIPPSNRGSYVTTVRNFDGSITLATANNIYIEWGIYKALGDDGAGSYTMYPFSHVDSNGLGGETFHASTGTPESVKTVYRNAITYLNSLCGINLRLGEDLPNNTFSISDGVHMLTIEEGAGLARASVRFVNCGNYDFYVYDMAVGFDNIGIASDFWIVVHEMGHAIGLAHSNGFMCPNTSCITSASAENITALNHIMNVSVNRGVSCFPIMDIGTLDMSKYVFDYKKATIIKYIDMVGRTTKTSSNLSSGVYIVEYEYEGIINRKLEIINNNNN